MIKKKNTLNLLSSLFLSPLFNLFPTASIPRRNHIEGPQSRICIPQLAEHSAGRKLGHLLAWHAASGGGGGGGARSGGVQGRCREGPEGIGTSALHVKLRSNANPPPPRISLTAYDAWEQWRVEEIGCCARHCCCCCCCCCGVRVLRCFYIYIYIITELALFFLLRGGGV